MRTPEIPSDGAYVAWKGWDDESAFGHLSAGEAAYFRDELKSVIQGRTITKVLEVGYGNGSFLTYCSQRGWPVVGTELATDLVTAGAGAGFEVYEAAHLGSFDEEEFDLVVLFDVLEHIPQETIVPFLTDLARISKSDGRIVMRFPNADSWLGNPLQNGDPTHVTAIGYLKMTYFARGAGLSIDSFRGARRRGFAESFAHGVYSLTFGPALRLAASVKRLLLFPGLPIDLSSSNVVCVVRKPQQGAT